MSNSSSTHTLNPGVRVLKYILEGGRYPAWCFQFKKLLDQTRFFILLGVREKTETKRQAGIHPPVSCSQQVNSSHRNWNVLGESVKASGERWGLSRVSLKAGRICLGKAGDSER